jgi:opacity protein-like surface antigen
MKRFLAGAAALAAVLASPAAAATLITNGSGQLTGATGVSVNGASYDVEFVEGTCAALFGGCDSISDFPFQNEADATTAMQALLDQVFTDGPVGQFNSDYSMTLGCDTNTTGGCTAMIPLELQFSSLTGRGAYNTDGSDYIIWTGLSSTYDTSLDNFWVWARFTPSLAAPPDPSAVPEPSTWAMMLLGFGAIGFAARRRRALAAPSLSSAGGEA